MRINRDGQVNQSSASQWVLQSRPRSFLTKYQTIALSKRQHLEMQLATRIIWVIKALLVLNHHTVFPLSQHSLLRLQTIHSCMLQIPRDLVLFSRKAVKRPTKQLKLIMTEIEDKTVTPSYLWKTHMLTTPDQDRKGQLPDRPRLKILMEVLQGRWVSSWWKTKHSDSHSSRLNSKLSREKDRSQDNKITSK